MSARKAQICTLKATYLGYKLKEGKGNLSERRIGAILQILCPSTKRQVWEFLGAVGYCRLWILGFAEIARPLYVSAGGKGDFLIWTEVEQKVFDDLKQALVSAPALALPDVQKPFQLFVSEVTGMAKGVLTQTLGPWKCPVAYLSKRLDYVVAGWPKCLRAITTMAILIKKADKLTLGQDLQVGAPHGVEALL